MQQTTQLLLGDCRDVLKTLADQSVQTVITSPPYFGLRDYGVDGQIGLETTPALYVAALVAVFREAWRVLRDDGTLWLNLGDSYAGNGNRSGEGETRALSSAKFHGGRAHLEQRRVTGDSGLPDKNLLGMPWRVAFALQDDGWYLRSDIIWSKPNCMPESVTDRPTRAHEYLFLFAKSARYYYDAQAIAEPAQGDSGWAKQRASGRSNWAQRPGIDTNGGNQGDGTLWQDTATRNKRTVWSIATQSFSGAHFATMPEALVEPCILAGSSARACEHCGAAWGRVVERDGVPRDRTIDSSGDLPGRIGNGKSGLNDLSGPAFAKWKAEHPNRDLGFAPRCACPANTGSAASIVLDPFAGTGTVMRVAQRYQRSAIGIELNPDYAVLSDARTDGVQVELFV